MKSVSSCIKLWFMTSLLCLLLNFSPTSGAAGIHDCVKASRKLAKQGDGSIEGSCMLCDPTYPECSQGCQKLVKNLYFDCDSVCLPDGYFFDPASRYAGCWEENKPDIKINVERCGCNAGHSIWQAGAGLSKVMMVLCVLVVAAPALW